MSVVSRKFIVAASFATDRFNLVFRSTFSGAIGLPASKQQQPIAAAEKRFRHPESGTVSGPSECSAALTAEELDKITKLLQCVLSPDLLDFFPLGCGKFGW